MNLYHFMLEKLSKYTLPNSPMALSRMYRSGRDLDFERTSTYSFGDAFGVYYNCNDVH